MKLNDLKRRIAEHVSSILKDTLNEDEYDLWRDAQFDPVAAAKLKGMRGGKAPTKKSGGRNPMLAKQKQYLNVPYAERDAAKAAGAKWDPEKKKWYVSVFPGHKFSVGDYPHWTA